jgi:hypothetical protein
MNITNRDMGVLHAHIKASSAATAALSNHLTQLLACEGTA